MSIEYLDKFPLKPDLIIILQENTNTIDFDRWNRELSNNSQRITQKYLYIFLKVDKSDVKGIYIGKSTTKNTDRLKSHFKGLKNLYNDFYKRMYHLFFDKDNDLPLYLLIFNWNKKRVIKNIFPFDLEYGLANAEAVLTSKLSYDYGDVFLNHEFLSRFRWAKTERNVKFETIPKDTIAKIEANEPETLWNSWWEKWFLRDNPILTGDLNIQPIKNHIYLFDVEDNRLAVKTTKLRNGKTILKLNPLMEQQVMDSVKLVEDSYNYYVSEERDQQKLFQEVKPYFSDGLIYTAYMLRSEIIKYMNKSSKIYPQSNSEFIPIYIGKTETLGRNGGFSGNLNGVSSGKNKNFFARWGYEDARHIGGLSLEFFGEENKYKSSNYEDWIRIMFNQSKREDKIPVLQLPIYFQMKPWFPYNISFNNKFGLFTPEMETFLIALARNLFPNILVNKKDR